MREYSISGRLNSGWPSIISMSYLEYVRKAHRLDVPFELRRTWTSWIFPNFSNFARMSFSSKDIGSKPIKSLRSDRRSISAGRIWSGLDIPGRILMPWNFSMHRYALFLMHKNCCKHMANKMWAHYNICYIIYAQLFLSFSWNVTNAQPLLWPVILSLRIWRSKIAPNWLKSSSSSVSVQSLGIWPTNNFMLWFVSIQNNII